MRLVSDASCVWETFTVVANCIAFHTFIRNVSIKNFLLLIQKLFITTNAHSYRFPLSVENMSLEKDERDVRVDTFLPNLPIIGTYFSLCLNPLVNIMLRTVKVRFQIHEETCMKEAVFWNVAACSLVSIDWRLRESAPYLRRQSS